MQKQMSKLPPRDIHGRVCRYLRMSVTDRCNLACTYCVSEGRQKFIPHDKILRYEEFLRIARIGASQGIKKTRITGGEPFARSGLMDFLRNFRMQLPEMQLCVTTNGTLLAPYIDELSKIGLHSINISLDSFDRETVRRLTGRDCMDHVLGSLESLLTRGQRVKINAVAIRGITDVQIKDYIHAVHHYPIDLRFIEFMPVGCNTRWTEENFISSAELFGLIRPHGLMRPAPNPELFPGPAQIYGIAGAKGRIGFISAVSNHFCGICNRLRITSDGHLRTCLFSDTEFDLSGALRNAKVKDDNISRIITGAMARKPLGNSILVERGRHPVAASQMVGIGG